VKKENGKMLFSGFDCVAMRVFSDLVTKLAMQPKTAANVVRAGLVYLNGLADTDDLESNEIVYVVVTNADKTDPKYKILKHSEIKSLYDVISPSGNIQLDPFTVVPFFYSNFAIQVSMAIKEAELDIGDDNWARKVKEWKKYDIATQIVKVKEEGERLSKIHKSSIEEHKELIKRLTKIAKSKS